MKNGNPNNVLIVNDYLLFGGTEIYTLNLRKILSQKYNVYLLTFDDKFEKNIKLIDNNSNIINIKQKKGIIKIFNKLFFNPFLSLKIKKIVKNINPSRVIINNVFYSPITVFESLKKYKIFQIVHDYSIVCPKLTCIKNNYEVCNGYKFEKCVKNCKYHNSKLKIIIKLLLVKRLERIRKKNINRFISPSKCLNEYLNSYGYNSITLNNPIDFSEFKNNVKQQKNNNTKKYIFVGNISISKGIFKFVEIFKKFDEDKNVKLIIIGNSKNIEEINNLKDIIKDDNKIEYLGPKEHKEVLLEINKSDFIVVPSIGMDNYPTTVLEGMLTKTYVLASDRGEMKNMLDEKRGIIFDIFNTEDVLKKLNMTYDMSEENYKKTIEKSYNYVINNNSFSNYKNKILKIIEE